MPYSAADYTSKSNGFCPPVSRKSLFHSCKGRAGLENKDDIFIVWMGENHGYSDNQNLIEQYHSILSMQDKHYGKFIVIGLTTGTASELESNLPLKI